MGSVGRALRGAIPWHVRLRALRPQSRNAVHGAGPPRREAALLRRAAGWHAAVRLRAKVLAGSSRTLAATSTPARSRSISRSDTSPSRGRFSPAQRSLPPAHFLVIRRGQPIPEPVEYWDVRFTLTNSISLDEACHELNRRLEESVRLRMISEVPLGAFLSGASIRAPWSRPWRASPTEPVNTCSIAFDDPAFDEARFAQQVADRYKTRHFVDHVASDDFDLVDQLASIYDEPYADSSAIPTYRVCQLARKHVTVALSGDGGDESFGGYRRYRMHLMEERLRSMLPLGVRQPVFGAALSHWRFILEGRLGAAHVPREDDLRIARTHFESRRICTVFRSSENRCAARCSRPRFEASSQDIERTRSSRAMRHAQVPMTALH